MKNSFKSILRAGLVIGLICVTTHIHAQITFNDDVNDVPAAPIDGFIGVGIIAGAYVILRKKYRSEE